MPGYIKITKLKNIAELNFDIPGTGVWLLSSANGGGKTTLLACIRRIGDSTAFPVHFPSSLQSDQLDNHLDGSIVYGINGEEVEYAYRGMRWTPRPRSQSNLLDRFGYPSVTYIGATAERLTPRSEDFFPGRVRAAKPNIISAANKIFNTTKFSNLKTVNLTKGSGNDAFVMQLTGSTGKKKYHSERHFSLGELCVLKLLKLLDGVNNNSLIIIDELEMALHPTAQVSLLSYIKEEADRKSLTVIFSTHSVTLLKSSHSSKIIFLDKDPNGVVRAVNPCYPTYALGHIAGNEESAPDAMIYVEDILAKNICDEMFRKFLAEKYKKTQNWPYVKIVAIGGFREVIKYLSQGRTVLPPNCKSMALLDDDVEKEALEYYKENNDHVNLKLFNENQSYIAYFPWTPEVGMVESINSDIDFYQKGVRASFLNQTLKFSGIDYESIASVDGVAKRSLAKNLLRETVDSLASKVGRESSDVESVIIKLFCDKVWAEHKSEFMAIFGRVC